MKKMPLAVAALIAGTSVAWAATPSETIAARQANFKTIGRAFKSINDELKKPAPALGVLQANARALNQASRHVGGSFPRGTGPETGIKMGALPAIWQRGPDFQRVTGQFAMQARALEGAATSGNLDRIRAAAQATGATCRSCHDSFRQRD